MSKFSFLNQSTFKIYSYKYRAFFTPVIVIVVCLILFVAVIIPLTQQWYDMQQQIAASQQKIDVLTQNLNFAGKINGSAVDSYLQLVTNVLPTNKDFIGVLAGISNASIDSAVSLNDYNFEVGDLSPGNNNGVSTIQVTITINGGIDDIKRFIASLRNQTPLSDVISIRLDSNRLASLSLVFYYKPYPGEISFQPAQPLQTLTPKEQSLLQTLISMNESSQKSTLNAQEKLIQ